MVGAWGHTKYYAIRVKEIEYEGVGLKHIALRVQWRILVNNAINFRIP